MPVFIAIFGFFAMLVIIGMGLISYLVFTANAHTENLFSEKTFDAVMAHTYCPRGTVTELPMRGRLVAQTAYLMARRFGCPIILAVGNTVHGEQRTESEIYKDFIVRFYDRAKEISFIIGRDKNARDTWRETTEAHRIAMVSGYKNILVLGMRPHLTRIIPYWRKINREEYIKIQFAGVYGPIRYYFWEAAMILAETIFPANSKRRDLILNLAGRKG